MVSGAARRHRAFHRDHVLGAHLLGAAVHRRVDVVVEDHLRDAVAVAQMDEDHAAQVAAAMHPAHQDDASCLRRRRATRRRCGCGEVRPENPVQQRFPYRLFLVRGRGELRARSPRASDSAARPWTCSSARSGRRRFRCRRRSGRSARPACWPVPWRASVCLRRSSTEVPARRKSRAITAAWRRAASPSGAMNRSSAAAVCSLFHAHHQPVFADRKADARRSAPSSRAIRPGRRSGRRRAPNSARPARRAPLRTSCACSNPGRAPGAAALRNRCRGRRDICFTASKCARQASHR